MNLQDLKAAYLSRHWASLDDSARDHVHGFVAFLEAALAALDHAPAADGQAAEPEASAMLAVVAAVTEVPAQPAAEAAPEAQAVDLAPEAAPAAEDAVQAQEPAAETAAAAPSEPEPGA